MPVRVTVVGSGSSLETDTLGGRGVGEGTEGLSGRRLAGQSRQQSASSGLVRRLLNRYRNRILDL